MQKKVLITGANGMVGKALIDFLLLQNTWRILAISRNITDLDSHPNLYCTSIDLLDAIALENYIAAEKPHYIINLAAQSSVGLSWKIPEQTIIDNVKMCTNLVNAIRLFSSETTLLHIGSAEVYGQLNEPKALTEVDILNPNNAYGISRVLQEKVLNLYAKQFDLKIIITRSFNHLSELQNDNFFIPSIINQIVTAKNAGEKTVHLQVGNIEVVRDFLDVQDVVEAYILLLTAGHNNEVYNVSSGNAYVLKDLIFALGKIADVEINISVNPAFVRAQDNPYLVGDNSKIKNALHWNPKYNLEETLTKMYNHRLHH